MECSHMYILNKFNILFQYINIAKGKATYSNTLENFFNAYFYALCERFSLPEFMLSSFYLWYSKVGFTYYMNGVGVWYVNSCA